MDDCDLEKLSAAPAKLSPKFNRNTTEYESTVPSSVEKVKVDCLTSDSGASYQVFGGGGEKTIPLTEGGITEIRIEVSAEDGTTKKYILCIKRLSASDATLSNLALTGGKLDPAFSINCYDYTCTVPCNMGEIPVKATAPDKKCVVVIANANEDCVVPLFLGETTLTVSVTSVDGKNTKDYRVVVTRKQLPWYVMLKDSDKAKSFECPMTLSPLYNPISIAGSDPKVSMSQPVIDMLTRRSKINPMNEMILEKDWRVVDGKLDKEISDFVAFSVYKYKGVSDELPLRKMADHINSCEQKPSPEVDTAKVTESSWYKAEFEGSSSATKNLQHKVEVRNWEKRLQHMAGDSNVDALLKDADKRQKQYKQKLPLKPGETLRFPEGESPADDLHQICISLSAAIKGKSKDAKVHMRLAFALEELHYLKEMFGLQKKDEDTEEHGAGTNIAAQESSKLEECQAICRLRGVSATAPIALQLKAIDEEYRSLRDGGQSSRADHVQALYAWRSKQALKGEQSSGRHTDENEPLAQAYLKYMDALACDANNYLCNLHVGRMLVDREDYKEAIVRLQQAVGLKPVSVEARFLLGVALCLQEGGAGTRISEALAYLHDGLDHLLMRRQKDAETEGINPSSNTDLHAEDFWRLCNIQLLQSLSMLASHIRKNSQPNMRSAKEIYHCVCLHASMALCSLFHRGTTFQQIEWLLLDAQYSLLELMMEEQPANNDWIAQRCRYLSAMIRTSTIPKESKLLTLQEKVCQKLVSINPCSSESLYLLGMSQLLLFDNDNGLGVANQAPLLDARQSFQVSIDLEGKPASGDVPAGIAGQKWWIDKMEAAKPKPAASTSDKNQPAARGRGGPAAAARGRGRGATVPAKVTPPARGRGAARPPARGRGAPPRGAKATPAADPKCSKEAEKPAQEKEAASVAKPSKPAPLNRVTYHARLGLARALSRTDDKKDEARKRYEEVMKMAPEVHDSYIELADLLVKSDPLAAVDIYCKFPSSDENTDSFDDAYLSGEIVSILMKHEKLDDPRLVEHMVKWGKVMGIGVLEKYMEILDAKFKTDMLKKIYCGVHGKDIDDPDLVAFFKFKCWI